MFNSPDFYPTATLEVLQLRARLLQAVRNFFASHSYWEAQTPVLSHDSCVDLWLDPFCVELGNGQRVYLQTSPEFALKRLICAGADRVFEVARVFRQDELGVRHNPEFTMIEWYARQDDHHAQMDFVELLVRQLAEFAAAECHRPQATPTSAPFARFTYAQAFQEFASLCPFTASLAELYAVAARHVPGLPAGIEEDREGLLNLLLADVIEPNFRKLRAVFLCDFPASQAALARIRPGSPAVAERFELYLDGVEICNGYHELTNADELRLRMQAQNQQRCRLGKPALPVESRLLQAMDVGMPECAGVALGFDRMAAWCLGLASIQDVIAFPFDRA